MVNLEKPQTHINNHFTQGMMRTAQSMKAMASVFPVAEQIGSRCVCVGGGDVCITRRMENTHCWSSEGGEPAEGEVVQVGTKEEERWQALELRGGRKKREERYAQLPEGRNRKVRLAGRRGCDGIKGCWGWN